MALGPETLKSSVLKRLEELEKIIDNRIEHAARETKPPEPLKITVGNDDLALFRLLIPRYQKAGWTKIDIGQMGTYNATFPAWFYYKIDLEENVSSKMTPENAISVRKIHVSDDR